MLDMQQLFALAVFTACVLTMQSVASQTCAENIDIQRLMNFFDETSRVNFMNSTSVLTFRPTQSLQGFGNLMVGAYGMILLAHAKGAVPLVAHSMVASMFDHPLSHEGLTFQKLLEEPDGTISLPSVTASGPDAIRDSGPGDVSYVNVLGTGDALKRGAARDMYADILNMSTTDPRLYDVMSTTAAQWMLSNPSPRFQRLYDDFKAEKQSQCSSGHFDVAIQLRTWKDWKNYYSIYVKNKECIVNCISSILLDAIHNIPKKTDGGGDGGGDGSSPPCVFFTSDSEADAADVINILKQRLAASSSPDSNVIRVAEFIASAPPIQTKAEFEHSDSYKPKSSNENHFKWRSDFVLRTSRDSFNIHDLSKRTDLLDWMLLGDIDVGIYTVGWVNNPSFFLFFQIKNSTSCMSSLSYACIVLPNIILFYFLINFYYST